MARLALALVERFAAERTAPAERAATVRSSPELGRYAGAPVEALAGQTLDRPLRARFPRPARLTLARIVSLTVDANAIVGARVRGALVDIWK